MLEKGKITHNQFTVLVIMYLIGSSILLVPASLAAKANQDAWIAAIFGVGVGSIFVMVYNALGNSYPTLTLAEYSEKILGKWLGKFVALFYFTFFFLIAALVLRNIGDFIVTYILPDTPIQFIEIIFLLVVIMGVHLGLEVFTRTSENLFPYVITLFFLTILLISPDIEFQNIQPILEKGVKPIIGGSFPYLGTPCLELVTLLMIFPYVNRNREAKKAFLIGYFIGGSTLIVITLVSILVIGPFLTSTQIYPTYIMVTKIDIGNFLERIEIIMAALWFMTIYIKLTISFYASSLCLAQVFNLKEYRFLLFPLGMIMLVLSIVAYPNSAYFQTVIGSIWFPYAFIYGGVLPVFLLVVGKIKGIFSEG